MIKEVRLSSGAVLKINMAPFVDSRALYQSVLEEMKTLKIDDNADIDANFFKDIFCSLLSSKKVEKEVWNCFGRATYNNTKISEETFEDEKAREDYIQVCFEVAWCNIAPFMKGLYAKLSPLLGMIKSTLP